MSVLVGCLRVEADRLGLAVIGLRSFNPRASVHKLAIPHIYSRIRETAVTSFSVRLNQGPITVLYALPSRHAHARSYGDFPVLLGVHLHVIGANRQTLSLSILAGLGYAVIPDHYVRTSRTD
jgi:hypothetical protein